MSDQLIVERGGLAKKDKSELQAIVSALGGTASSRARKADLIDQIVELAGAADSDSGSAGGGGAEKPESSDTSQESGADAGGGTSSTTTSEPSPSSNGTPEVSEHPVGPDGEPLADWEVEMMQDEGGSATKRSRGSGGAADRNQGDAGRPARSEGARGDSAKAGETKGDSSKGDSSKGDSSRGDSSRGDSSKGDSSRGDSSKGDSSKGDSSKGDSSKGEGGRSDKGDGGDKGEGGRGSNDRGSNRDTNRDSNRDDADPNNRRSRRRGRSRGRDSREDVGNEAVTTDPVPVDGYLDLREEGYGFLRVAGNLPSKEDVYVSVKQVRQYGLRRGDRITGLSRPANRNEKNPGFHQIDTVNGQPPEEGRKRVHFDDLTPLFPDEHLVLEMRDEPLNMTTRIIDLVCPIGKGQRGLIVSPPKAGKTTVMKDIARAIETNNPDVHLMVLLLDERPEEVTDMRRHLKQGEVASSTFDRPPEEHCAVAELTIEKAKRMVERGEDVVLIVDGITRLVRAYNMVAPQSGRAMSGGLDASALYPPKRFFGAARNLEEGGSLTILATALVETGSRMDEVIFEEFKGTGNMELRLDRHLAEKRIFPAIDIDGSSTRHEELLYDRGVKQQAWKLRRVLSGMSEEGSSASAIEMLIDRLKTFKTNADFLAEIGKAPSV